MPDLSSHHLGTKGGVSGRLPAMLSVEVPALCGSRAVDGVPLTSRYPVVSRAACLGITQGAVRFIIERDDQTPEPSMLVHDAHLPCEEALVINVDAGIVAGHGGQLSRRRYAT